jgi:hypothetical protein
VTIDPAVLESHHVAVRADSDFQAELRLRQALWRETAGLPCGDNRGRPLGSRLAMPYARETLANYLTPRIRDVVRHEVLDPQRAKGKLFGKPRIFDNLLSSQPLCFNLFGELSADLDAASAVFARAFPGRVHRVARVDFEWSPGRDDPRYLANRSAFDVFVHHSTPDGGRGFIGIEVKYHEDLSGKAAQHTDRYDEVALRSRVFTAPGDALLRHQPLQQMWLDHLLALSMLAADDGWDSGLFVFLHPTGNEACAATVADYRSRLRDDATFATLTLERFVDFVGWSTKDGWVDEFRRRYLTSSAELLGAA